MRYILRACKERESYLKDILIEIPELEIVWDQKRNAMDTFLRALEYSGNEPHIMLEDDVILCKNFKRRTNLIIEKNKDIVINFFSMREDRLKIGNRLDNSLAFTVCLYIPKGYPNLISEFYKTWKHKEKHPTGFDLTINDFLKSKKEKYLLCYPNLANHRIGVSQIDRRRSSKRVSKTFQYEDDNE